MTVGMLRGDAGRARHLDRARDAPGGRPAPRPAGFGPPPRRRTRRGRRSPPTRSATSRRSTSTSRGPTCPPTTAAPRTSATWSRAIDRAFFGEVLPRLGPAHGGRGHGRPRHLVPAQGAHRGPGAPRRERGARDARRHRPPSESGPAPRARWGSCSGRRSCRGSARSSVTERSWIAAIADSCPVSGAHRLGPAGTSELRCRGPGVPLSSAPVSDDRHDVPGEDRGARPAPTRQAAGVEDDLVETEIDLGSRAPKEDHRASPWQIFWRQFRRDRWALVGIVDDRHHDRAGDHRPAVRRDGRATTRTT